MYTDFNHLFTITTRNVWRIKEKLCLPPHLYSVTPYPAKHTLLLISMLHFRMCNILKFTQNSLVVHIPYLLIYSQQWFVTTLLRYIAFMRNMFSVLMVLIKQRSLCVILPILNHIKRLNLKPLKQKTLPINTTWCIRRWRFRDPSLCRFHSVPACDGQTDGQPASYAGAL